LSPRLWPHNAWRPKKDLHELAPSDAIAGLLADADEQEVRFQHASSASQFEEVMEEIIAETDPEALVPDRYLGVPLETTTIVIDPVPSPARRPERFEEPSRPAPRLATNPGDLVFVFGLREDALTVAQAMAVATPAIEVAVAGTVGRTGARHVGGRREALQARADGVRRNGSTIVAIGVGESPAEASRYAGILHDVVPDQVWIAVDVTRKPEDTRAWANLVAEAGDGVDAIAAIGVAHTTTPDSTSLLGVPVGWSDR
jgi:hypothetical protein